MTVRELIDDLKGLDPEADVTFHVQGDITIKQELEGRYNGFYDFDHCLDDPCDLDGIDESARFCLWVR